MSCDRDIHLARYGPRGPKTWAPWRSFSTVWVDVEALQEAAADARRSHDPATYRSALALYHDDLLPEDLYEDWAADRREGLRSLFLSLLLELAGLYEHEGQLGAAIEALQRAVSSDPTLEEAHAGLMRLYTRAGQRHQALRQYVHIARAGRILVEHG